MPSWPEDENAPFDPATTPAAPDLGAIADMFWRLRGVVRSDHLQAFAAAGPRARALTADPLPLPPHVPASPVGRVHDLDGQVLLLGVGHEANTTLHLAEVLARVPYGVPRTCTAFRDGRLVRITYRENDHCCARFALADEWLRARGLQREGRVGHAHARLARARNVVAVALEHLARDPLVFLHPASARCTECDEARASVRDGGASPGEFRSRDRLRRPRSGHPEECSRRRRLRALGATAVATGRSLLRVSREDGSRRAALLALDSADVVIRPGAIAGGRTASSPQ
jgi:aminoglycoside N3'-acetyltransferase